MPEPGEQALDDLDHALAGHLAADGDDDTLGPEDLAVVREEVRTSEPLHALPRADARPGVRVAGVEVGQHSVEAQRERRVRACLDLAQHQTALALDFLGRKGRIKRDLGNETEQRLPVARQRLAAELGRLDLARGLETSAEILRCLGKLHGGARARSAGHRPQQEVRESRPLPSLEPRAGAHLERYGDDRRGGVLAHQHRQAVLEDAATHGRFRGGGSDRQRERDDGGRGAQEYPRHLVAGSARPA